MGRVLEPQLKFLGAWLGRRRNKAMIQMALFALPYVFLDLWAPVSLGVADVHHPARESLLVPATYEPITIAVRVTAYNPVRDQTDETPYTMASGKTVYGGAVALSRDLEADLGLSFGDLIEIDGLGLFRFEDRMHRRWRRTVDILFFSPERAKRFGIQYSFLRLP
jgi:hypothetical protein